MARRDVGRGACCSRHAMGDLTKIRREIGQLPAGRGRRYSASLKQRALAAARSGRAAGETWAYLGEEIGIPADTLQRWDEEAGQVSFKPVALVADPMSSADREIVVVTPGGFRVLGLDVGGAAALVRKLSR